jgi:predicted transcriptional regulator
MLAQRMGKATCSVSTHAKKLRDRGLVEWKRIRVNGNPAYIYRD